MEHLHRAKFMRMIEPMLANRAVLFRHEDKLTAGVPDLSINSHVTSWIEFKSQTTGSDLHLRGRQHANMRKLELCSYARYIVFVETLVERRIHIVKPSDMKEWRTNSIVISGFDYRALASLIAARHLP